MKRLSLLLLLGVVVTAAAAGAQQPDGTPAGTRQADSLFARARQLVLEGNGPAGRAIIDSIVAATDPVSPAYADALYWRATLAATAAEAERDYRRIIVEHSLSRRATEALLALAQLEMSRGDRAGAMEHLDRFLLENPGSSERGRAGLWLARLLVEQGKLPRGCTVLGRARSDVAADAVELRNQLDYYAQRCVGVDTVEAPARAVRGARGDSAKGPPAAVVRRAPRDSGGAHAAPNDSAKRTPVPDAARPVRDTTKPVKDTARTVRDTTKPAEDTTRTVRDTTKPAGDAAKPRPAATTRYSVQLAAYDSRAQADALAQRLTQRGLAARVYGSQRPFRVRVGRYATQNQAEALLKQLLAQGMSGFVTAAEPEGGAP